MTIHLSKIAQIVKTNPVNIGALYWDKTPTKIHSNYIGNFPCVFSLDLAMELPNNTGINKHAIKLVDDKQLLYRLIYILNPVELETLKIYIKTHLKQGLSNLPSLLHVSLSTLIRNLILTFAYTLIIKTFIIPLLRIGTLFRLLVNG